MGVYRPWTRVIEFLVVLTIIAFVFIQIGFDYRRATDDAHAEGQRLRSVVAAEMAQTLGTIEAVLGALARDVVNEPDLRALGINLDLSRRGLPYVSNLLVLDQTGQVVADARSTGLFGHDFSPHPLFLVHRYGNNGQLFISEPMPELPSQPLGPWVINISQQVVNQAGQLQGVLVASLSVEALANAFDLLRSHRDDVVGVVRQDGSLMARSPFIIDVEARALFDAGSVGPQAALADAGIYQNHSLNYRVDRHFSFERIKQYPVSAYAGVSLDHRLAAWARRAATDIALGLLTIALVLAFGQVWRRTLRQREQETERRLARLNGLVRLSSELIACLSPEAAAKLLAARIRQLIPCGSAKVTLFNPHQVVLSGASPEGCEHRSGDAPHDGRLVGVLRNEHGVDIGEVHVCDPESGRFSPEDNALMLEIAQIASLSFQKIDAELRSRVAARRLQNVLNSMSDAVYMVDNDWRFLFMNDYARRLLEQVDMELIGRDLWQVFPDLRGTEVENQFRKAVDSRNDVDFEYYSPHFDGWFHIRAYPGREGLTVYLQDISIQKLRDEQLRQSQKLEAMGQLTGGVAHDFNNLLTVILGNAEMLTESLVADARLQALARSTVHAASRGAELTAHLLAFARRQPLDPKPTRLSRIIDHMIPILRRTLGENITVRPALQNDIWPVLIDAAQFESVVLNLSLNARDAMPEGGQLVIRTMNIELGPMDTLALDDIRPGDYVSLMVSDSGVGMDKEALERVFDPFFTTKEQGKGSGLGLSMVHGFVKQSGGAIRIFSRPNEGTTVQIYLPRCEQPEPSHELPVLPDPPHRGREIVLVVEDEPMVRNFVSLQLKAMGYQVYVADGPHAALRLMAQLSQLDLLFTDIMMPGGMNGRQLADEAVAYHPTLKVLFTSGYSDDVIMRDGFLEPGMHLLKKPYRKAELAAALRKVLDETVAQ